MTKVKLLQVFWIIVGTGSVNVISFNTLSNATTEPPSTAKSTPSQYGGRRLLQTSQSAENVVFSVTLPTASQNSLLVLQSSSDTVRQQFAGWFVTQMAARGGHTASNAHFTCLKMLQSLRLRQADQERYPMHCSETLPLLNSFFCVLQEALFGLAGQCIHTGTIFDSLQY